MMKINKQSSKQSNKLAIVDAYNKHIVFNFSYMTTNNKYSMDALKNNKRVKEKLMDRLLELSIDDKVTVLSLPKERGFEKLSESSLKHNIKTPKFDRERSQFLNTQDDIWVFRIGDLGRVLGKFHDQIFYVMAIDTKFDLYEH